MQSADYVPGISGWKIHDHVRLVINDGNRRIHAEVKMITTAGPGQNNDEAAQAIRDLVQESKDQRDSRVTACEGRVAACGSQVTAQGAPIAALGHAVADPGSKAECTAVSRLTSRFASEDESTPPVDRSGYITGEKLARQAMEEAVSRAEADLALAKRIGSYECKLSAGTVKVTLAADVPSDEEIKGEPLFVVIDGQVFINNATLKDSAIDPARIKVESDKARSDHPVLEGYRVKLAVNEQGQYYVAGVGVGMSPVTSGLKLGPCLEEDVRRLLREELIGAGAEKAMNERLGKIELDLVTRKCREDAAKIIIEQRLAALESVVGSLKLG